MKRLNPLTEQPFEKRDVRNDGFIFKSYDYRHLRKNGFYAEVWLNSISFKKCVTEDKRKKNKAEIQNTLNKTDQKEMHLLLKEKLQN
jgi:hypothetical protein